MYAHELAHTLSAYLGGQHIPDKGTNGLQITNTAKIATVATAVTADLATIHTACQQGVDALIVHHGILNPFPITDTITYQKVALLLKYNIALLGYHLPLDAHQIVGNNWCAARDLGWQNLEPFGLHGNAAIGVRGSFAPIPTEQFVQQLQRYYGNRATSIQLTETISSAALVSGRGYTFIDQAKAAGVDCLVTGSFDEPAWYDAHAYGISFFALGHAATEKVGPRALANYIQDTYGIESFFIDTDNPF